MKYKLNITKKKTYNVEINGGRQREGRGEVVEEKGEG